MRSRTVRCRLLRQRGSSLLFHSVPSPPAIAFANLSSCPPSSQFVIFCMILYIWFPPNLQILAITARLLAVRDVIVHAFPAVTKILALRVALLKSTLAVFQCHMKAHKIITLHHSDSPTLPQAHSFFQPVSLILQFPLHTLPLWLCPWQSSCQCNGLHKLINGSDLCLDLLSCHILIHAAILLSSEYSGICGTYTHSFMNSRLKRISIRRMVLYASFCPAYPLHD